MEKSKVGSYLGFCIRARKILFGVDNVEKQRKGVYLLITDEKISENSFKAMIKAKEKFACPHLIAKSGVLGELACRPSVKAVGITDEHLAGAIVSVANGDLFKFHGGNNEDNGKEI